MTGVTATAAELNALDGITATVTELNYTDGVTSAIQTQLDTKAPLAAPSFTGNATGVNLTLSGNLTVNGTTTTVSSTNTVVSDALLELGSGTTGTPANDAGIVIERGDSNNAFIGFDESADKFIVGTGTFTGSSTGDLTITTGTLVANVEGNVTGNVTGNADTATTLETARTIGGVSFNGSANINLPGVNTSGNQDTSGNAATATALETARTIGGVSFDGTGNINLPGVNTAGNQDTSGTAAVATVATTVTITDNESTNENNAIIFTAGGAQTGGNLGLESDGTLTYNPSTGKITATGFVGALTGNADTATALATGRTIALSGDVAATGVSFDGTGNISLTTVIQSLSVENGMIAADAVNGTKIADNSINSEHYVDGSIDRVHLAADIVDGTKIADDSINSEHYVNGSIDTAHIGNDQVTEAKIADDAVGSAQLKSLSTLLIKNSAGTTLKTLHAAGA